MQSIPTSTNIDHYAFTVPDLAKAVTFFEKAFGARTAYILEDVNGGSTNWMSEHLDVHPRASADIAMLRLGPVTNIELFEYRSPDQRANPPRVNDLGGHHLAFLVTDVDAAVDHFRQFPEVRILGEPQTMGPGFPNEGDRWIYFVTTWGFHFEVHSVPATMPYESQTTARRYGPSPQWDSDGESTPVTIPTATNVDHLGITVRSLDDSIEFITNHLGGELLYELGPFDLTGSFPHTQLNIEGEGSLRQALIRVGPTDHLELFEYAIPGSSRIAPKNSDVGGTHIAFHVNDVEQAVAYLNKIPGVEILGSPDTILEGPIAGDTWAYFRTPIGLYMEILCMPDGQLPYEATTSIRRRSATTPWTTLSPRTESLEAQNAS